MCSSKGGNHMKTSPSLSPSDSVAREVRDCSHKPRGTAAATQTRSPRAQADQVQRTKDAAKVPRPVPWAAAAFGRASGGNAQGPPWSVVAEDRLPLLPWSGHLHVSCPSLLPRSETCSKRSPPRQETARTIRPSPTRPSPHQMLYHGGHAKLPSWENPTGSASVKGFPGAALPAGDGRAAPDAPSCACQPLPGISTPLCALRQFYLSFKSIQIVLFPCESAHLVYVLQCQRGNL